MSINNEVREICKRAGLSVRQAGIIAGIPRSTIYSWTASAGSKALRIPLPASVLGFRLLIALHTSKNGVFVNKSGAITQLNSLDVIL